MLLDIKPVLRAIRAVLEECKEQDVKVLTLFAFSTENWERPPEEVEQLMKLFNTYLKRELKLMIENKVRLRFIGSRRRFTEDLRRLMAEAEERTQAYQERTLVIAVDYGGQWDIADAARRIALDAKVGTLDPQSIDEDTFHRYTSLSQLPAVDLCIRTGGEHRISNFLLWQLAYSELYFTDAYWPDFSGEDLRCAIDDFCQRQRRFGQTGEQLESLNDQEVENA